MRRRASHKDSSSVVASEAVVRLPDAAYDKDDVYDKGGNNVNALLCRGTKDLLLFEGRHAMESI